MRTRTQGVVEFLATYERVFLAGKSKISSTGIAARELLAANVPLSKGNCFIS
jgi:hypothetical protein